MLSRPCCWYVNAQGGGLWRALVSCVDTGDCALCTLVFGGSIYPNCVRHQPAILLQTCTRRHRASTALCKCLTGMAFAGTVGTPCAARPVRAQNNSTHISSAFVRNHVSISKSEALAGCSQPFAASLPRRSGLATRQVTTAAQKGAFDDALNASGRHGCCASAAAAAVAHHHPQSPA